MNPIVGYSDCIAELVDSLPDLIGCDPIDLDGVTDLVIRWGMDHGVEVIANNITMVRYPWGHDFPSKVFPELNKWLVKYTGIRTEDTPGVKNVTIHVPLEDVVMFTVEGMVGS